MRTVAERMRDVRALLDVARAVVRDRAALIDPLVAATGLSRENVELGLTRHLETDANDEELAMLVARAGDAEAVHVVLSANVFTAPLRALALARAAAPIVTVRPSRRDPILARAIVDAARDPALVLFESASPADIERGEIHVYGRDETIASVRASARPNVRVRGHGAGMGVALVSGRVAIDDAAARIAGDVVPFDQRGCLSPRVALLVGDAARAGAFAAALANALESLAVEVPRGALDEAEREAATRYAEALAFAGKVHVGSASMVGLAERVTVPPTGRHVHVAWAKDADAARAALTPFAPFIAAASSDDAALLAAAAPERARQCDLGAMQRPPLDGPVDLR